MRLPELFHVYPELTPLLPWHPLVSKATPVHALSSFARNRGVELYVKREDMTAGIYGGNKVRNLEFIFGKALKEKKRRLVTVAPLGSNFVAALAAQAKPVGLQVDVFHFTPALSEQARAHRNFTLAQDANLSVYHGRVGTLPAAIGAAMKLSLNRDSQWVSPGGSSVLGALGHVNSALELHRQIREGETPVPDYLVVGAGTCGTIAGLSVGLEIAKLPTKIIGIRCVDRLVCNTRAIRALAQGVARVLGVSGKGISTRFELRSQSGDPGYGVSSSDFSETTKEFFESEGIRLDTTYTSKVVRATKAGILNGEFRGKRVLYWHTYSPHAMAYAGTAPISTSLQEFCKGITTANLPCC